MNELHSLLLVAVVATVTVVLRFLPFWLVRLGGRTPPAVTYLGKVLPYAIMGMLVVFCLKGVSLRSAPHGLPEFIAAAVVVLLHILKRNTLLSVVFGTVCYMLLVQQVF